MNVYACIECGEWFSTTYHPDLCPACLTEQQRKITERKGRMAFRSEGVGRAHMLHLPRIASAWPLLVPRCKVDS